MHTFLETLHVIAAIFIIGPLVVVPMTGLRYLRTSDARGLHSAARQTTVYSLLSLLVLGLGLLVVAVEERRYSFGTAWVNVSITLYVIAVLVALFVVAPSLSKSAKMLSSPVPEEIEGEDEQQEIAPLASQNSEIKPKLDAARGRIAASSGIVAVLMVATAALMVIKPFG